MSRERPRLRRRDHGEALALGGAGDSPIVGDEFGEVLAQGRRRHVYRVESAERGFLDVSGRAKQGLVHVEHLDRRQQSARPGDRGRALPADGADGKEPEELEITIEQPPPKPEIEEEEEREPVGVGAKSAGADDGEDAGDSDAGSGPGRLPEGDDELDIDALRRNPPEESGEPE